MKISEYQERIIDAIFETVETETGFGREDIRSRRRTHELVVARFIAIFLAKKITRMKLKSLGWSFNRDHSSIIHALTEVRVWVEAPMRYLPEMIQLQKIETEVDRRVGAYVVEKIRLVKEVKDTSRTTSI
jgi:chromosomal replication initiation ATPase DnaA